MGNKGKRKREKKGKKWEMERKRGDKRVKEVKKKKEKGKKWDMERKREGIGEGKGSERDKYKLLSLIYMITCSKRG